jgi:hypothetical protein
VRDSFAASESVELAPNGVAGLRRNGWPTSVGTGGRIASESVAGLARITQLMMQLSPHAELNCLGCDRQFGNRTICIELGPN